MNKEKLNAIRRRNSEVAYLNSLYDEDDDYIPHRFPLPICSPEEEFVNWFIRRAISLSESDKNFYG